LYVADLMHTTHVATATGWLFAASGLAGGIGSYMAGRVFRRVGLRRMLVLVIAAASILLIPLAFVQSHEVLLDGRCCAGVAFGARLRRRCQGRCGAQRCWCRGGLCRVGKSGFRLRWYAGGEGAPGCGSGVGR